MFNKTIEKLSEAARSKSEYLKKTPLGFTVASMLAGIYVGFGITLVFAIGAPFAAAGHPGVKLVMGAAFGVALTLVIFAGSELFTGNTMITVFGIARKTISVRSALAILLMSWLGNLAGSMVLGLLARYSGALNHAMPLVLQATAAKMNAPAGELVLRGVLCNMLVCLAIWSGTRMKSEAARLILIFWCLFAFVGAGYEHSIANMSLFTIALFGQKTAGVNWLGFARNLLLVSGGNLIGGSVFIAGSYLLSSKKMQ